MAAEFIGRIVKRDGKVGIVPDTALDREQLELVKAKDKPVKVKVWVPRNPKFHRKGFALIGVIFECMEDDTKRNLGIYTAEMLRKRILLDLGRFEVMVMGPGNAAIPEGSVIYEAQSMNFESMDDTEFEKLYNQIMMIAVEKYAQNQTQESLDRMVDEVLRFGEHGR